jgi:hypothetical protein
MHRLWIVIAMVIGCDARSVPLKTDAHVDAKIYPDACPPFYPGNSCDKQGFYCEFPTDAGRKEACGCQNGMWECDTCPFGNGPAPACTPGDTCHRDALGCRCTCNGNGTWSCDHADCPVPYDAGIGGD